MLGLEELYLGDLRNVGVACFGAMTGQVENLEIVGFDCPVKGYEPQS